MDERCPCKLCGENAAVPRYDLQDTVVFACTRCDFHFIRYLDATAPPAEDGEGLDEKAWNYIEERLPSAAGLLPARLGLVQKYRALAGARCLDVGAGVGQFLLRLAGEGALAQGIEPSRLRRRFAEGKFGLRLDSEPVESRCWQERFAANFDVVTLWDVIEHVNSPLETVRSIYALLKPGGLLFIDTPSRQAPAYRLSELFYRLSRRADIALSAKLLRPRAFRSQADLHSRAVGRAG